MTVVTITASNNNSGIKKNDARAFPILDPCIARTPIIAAACTGTRVPQLALYFHCKYSRWRRPGAGLFINPDHAQCGPRAMLLLPRFYLAGFCWYTAIRIVGIRPFLLSSMKTGYVCLCECRSLYSYALIYTTFFLSKRTAVIIMYKILFPNIVTFQNH